MSEEKPLILVVDDSPQNLKLSRFLLEAAAFQVITAPDAEHALTIVEEATPTLILVDIQLPGMDGLELTRHFRQIERLNNTGIVALTAYAMKGDEQRAFDAGCDGYITKPIDTRSFASTVRTYFKQIESSVPAGGNSASPDEFDLIRKRFFNASRQSVSEMLADSNWVNNPKSKTYLHQIAGTGGTFGAHEISSIAAEAESRLRQQSTDDSSNLGNLLLKLRDALDNASPSSSQSDHDVRYEKKG